MCNGNTIIKLFEVRNRIIQKIVQAKGKDKDFYNESLRNIERAIGFIISPSSIR